MLAPHRAKREIQVGQEGQQTFIIVGAGHGAGQAVSSLRSGGFEGRIVLIGEEPYIPYQRPPLSKKFLAGEMAVDRLYFKPEKFYHDRDVELKLNTRVTQIDRAAKTVTTSAGDTFAYNKLLLMTGTRVRKLKVPGADLPGVCYLRNIEDVDQMRDAFKPGAKLAVIGGGYIGMEVAAVANKMGLQVTVIEALERIMSRGIGEEVSNFFQDMHREEGVTILTNKGVSGFEGETHISQVVCADGTKVDADIAVVGIGVLPNQELAEEAGLKCDNGIVVDEFCRTEDPDIFAGGDCTNHPNPLLNRTLRLESVHNAVEQGKTAAASMLGESKAYAQVPWFWSDQYDVKLQIAGMPDGYDNHVVRGDPSKRKFAVFYLKDSKIICVFAINAMAEYMQGRKLIERAAIVSSDRLADTSINMKEIIQES